MVQLNGFGIEIISLTGTIDKFSRNGARYVGLNNGTEYKIKLNNYRDTRCDVELKLEGEHVGLWRIDPHDSITLERPVNKAKKFTFFGEMTMEAIDAGAIAGESTNGLVKAKFYPQKEISYEKIEKTRSYAPEKLMAKPQGIRSLSSEEYSGGVTLLGEHSSQKFTTVDALRKDQIDWDQVTVIRLRLVVKKPISHTNPYPSPI